MVERLGASPFKRKTRVRLPELAPTYHSFVFIYPSYSSSYDGWGRKMSVLNCTVNALILIEKEEAKMLVDKEINQTHINVHVFRHICNS